MKHYRIVKKSTHFLIAISAFAIIFNITLFGAAAFGLFKISKPEKISAACVSGDKVSIALGDTNTNKEINKPFTVKVSSTDDLPSTTVAGSGVYYAFVIRVTDVETDTVGFSSGEQKASLGARLTPFSYDITINGLGDKIIDVIYIKMMADGTWCTDWTESATFLAIKGVDRASDSPNITITVAEKVDQGASTTIKSTITGAETNLYELLISKGGDCPSTPITDSHCWFKYGGGTVGPSPYEFTKNWPTTIPGTDIGRHGIGVIVWPAVGGDKTKPSDSKIVYMTICEPGTSGTTCVGAGGPADPGASGPEENIETPDKIEKFSSFATDFFLPVKKITGAGDLTIVILYVMGYLIGALAFLGIIVSGIQYISSGGDSSKSEKAKKNLIYCVIGIVIAVLAFSIQAIVATFWK